MPRTAEGLPLGLRPLRPSTPPKLICRPHNEWEWTPLLPHPVQPSPHIEGSPTRTKVLCNTTLSPPQHLGTPRDPPLSLLRADATLTLTNLTNPHVLPTPSAMPSDHLQTLSISAPPPLPAAPAPQRPQSAIDTGSAGRGARTVPVRKLRCGGPPGQALLGRCPGGELVICVPCRTCGNPRIAVRNPPGAHGDPFSLRLFCCGTRGGPGQAVGSCISVQIGGARCYF